MFRFLCVASVLFIAFCAISITNQEEVTSFVRRVDHPKKAVYGLFPWQAALILTEKRGRFLCGGALINMKWVLTSAHCLYKIESIKIILGNIWPAYNDVHTVTEKSQNYILHENYDFRTGTNNIGLIRLENPVPLSETIIPIRLDDLPLESGEIVLTSGWGVTNATTMLSSPILNYVNLITINKTECDQLYRQPVPETVACATVVRPESAPEGTCYGDSGGPLVLYPRGVPLLVGVGLSRSKRKCQEDLPERFVRVHSFLDWIRTNTGISR